MQNAAGDGIEIRPDDLDYACHLVVSDLVSLLGHVQASLKLIESAVASETSRGNLDAAANIIVLDDVTPRYAKVSASLKACDASLGITLHFLLDSGTSMCAAEALAASPPALSLVRG
jgi:hypothetical protein